MYVFVHDHGDLNKRGDPGGNIRGRVGKEGRGNAVTSSGDGQITEREDTFLLQSA